MMMINTNDEITEATMVVVLCLEASKDKKRSKFTDTYTEN